MKKKLVFVMIAAILILSVAGCQNNGSASSKADNAVSETEDNLSSTEVPEGLDVQESVEVEMGPEDEVLIR